MRQVMQSPPYVRLSVRLFSLYLRSRLTVDLELLHVSMSWPQLTGDWRSRSRSWVRLMWWFDLDQGQLFLAVVYCCSPSLLPSVLTISKLQQRLISLVVCLFSACNIHCLTIFLSHNKRNCAQQLQSGFWVLTVKYSLLFMKYAWTMDDLTKLNNFAEEGTPLL